MQSSWQPETKRGQTRGRTCPPLVSCSEAIAPCARSPLVRRSSHCGSARKSNAVVCGAASASATAAGHQRSEPEEPAVHSAPHGVVSAATTAERECARTSSRCCIGGSPAARVDAMLTCHRIAVPSACMTTPLTPRCCGLRESWNDLTAAEALAVHGLIACVVYADKVDEVGSTAGAMHENANPTVRSGCGHISNALRPVHSLKLAPHGEAAGYAQLTTKTHVKPSHPISCAMLSMCQACKMSGPGES